MWEFYIGDGFAAAKPPDKNPLVSMFIGFVIFLGQRKKRPKSVLYQK